MGWGMLLNTWTLDIVKAEHLDDGLNTSVSSLHLVVMRTQYIPGIC